MVRIKSLVVGLLASSGLGGCLVAEPPELEDPGQTRPYLLIRDIQPSPAKVEPLVLPELAPKQRLLEFNVPVQSEDREPLWAFLHIDLFTGTPNTFIDFASLSPSTFAAGTRSMAFDWTADESDVGCHRLTAVFGHQSSFDPGTQLIRLEANADSETVSWLVNVIDGDDTTALADCPSQTIDNPAQ
jgi:hypothetical protein